MNRPLTTSLVGIPKLAKDIAKNLRGGEILALVGPLGSGKTTFTQALAKQLKIKQAVTSPTFVIMNVLKGRLPKNKIPILLFHLDLYRCKNFAEVKALGLGQTWGQPGTVTVIEWADKIRRHWPKKTKQIKFL